MVLGGALLLVGCVAVVAFFWWVEGMDDRLNNWLELRRLLDPGVGDVRLMAAGVAAWVRRVMS